MQQTQKLDEKFAMWNGIPRQEIEWSPKIDESQCIGCGMCVISCGRNVFAFDTEKNVAVVARPLQCMVGCTSCEVWCYFDAISFPDPQYVKNLIKERKVLVLAKKKLLERIKQTSH